MLMEQLGSDAATHTGIGTESLGHLDLVTGLLDHQITGSRGHRVNFVTFRFGSSGTSVVEKMPNFTEVT